MCSASQVTTDDTSREAAKAPGASQRPVKRQNKSEMSAEMLGSISILPG